MKKRFLAFFTAVALCLSLWPLGAWAADGGGDTPTDVPAAGTDELTKELLEDVSYVDFSDEYKSKFVDLTYGDTSSIKAPKADDIVFLVEEKKYKAPEKTEITTTWSCGDKEVTAPKDAAEYTLTAAVTVTFEDTTQPAPGPDTPPTTRAAKTENFTTQELSFTIKPKEITPEIKGNVSKVYDGTEEYTVSEKNPLPIELNGVVKGDDVSVEGTYTFSGFDAGTQYAFHARGLRLVGDDSKNYTLSTKELDGQGTITQAEISSSVKNSTIVLRNNRDPHTYTFDLLNLLPKLPAGQYYGEKFTDSVKEFKIKTVSIYNDNYCTADDIEIDGNTLSIEAKKAKHTNEAKIGSIEVTVTTDNFEPFTSTITLMSANKTQVDISGLTPVRQTYNGSTVKGFTGTPAFAPADESSTEKIEGLTESDLEYMYESTTLSQTKYGPSAAAPTEPGDYVVTVSIKDSQPDYTGEKELNFVISRAKVTVAAARRTIKVDDPVPSLSSPELGVDYTVTGLAPGDKLRQPPAMRYATVADSIAEGEFEILIDGAEVPDTTHYDPAIEYKPGKLVVSALTDKQENPFSDVGEYAWYVTAVKYVYNMGLMKGVTATLFSPTGSLTRAQAVTILYRMADEPYVWKTMPYTDVDSSAYYMDAVRWASANRIVNGYGDGRFGPGDVLTREQLAIILYNFSQYYGKTPNKAASLDHYTDAYRTSAQGYRALQWACAEGLIQGTGSTTLSPKDRALRAQVAVILTRYCTNILELAEP